MQATVTRTQDRRAVKRRPRWDTRTRRTHSPIDSGAASPRTGGLGDDDVHYRGHIGRDREPEGDVPAAAQAET